MWGFFKTKLTVFYRANVQKRSLPSEDLLPTEDERVVRKLGVLKEFCYASETYKLIKTKKLFMNLYYISF